VLSSDCEIIYIVRGTCETSIQSANLRCNISQFIPRTVQQKAHRLNANYQMLAPFTFIHASHFFHRCAAAVCIACLYYYQSEASFPFSYIPYMGFFHSPTEVRKGKGTTSTEEKFRNKIHFCLCPVLRHKEDGLPCAVYHKELEQHNGIP
jgi:hypothetical protein